MSQPSVAKAFSDSIAPVLTAAGFSRDGTKRFLRICGDLCQCIFLHVESRTQRQFMLEYCTFLTAVPHAHYPLDHGGRFPVGSRGIWFRADTDERLARSIASINEHLPQLLDWFQRTGTIDGYISTYLALGQSQPPAFSHNGHFSFNLGCAYLLAGDPAKGLHQITMAEEDFESIISRTPETQVWAVPCRDRSRELASRIPVATHHSLLDAWRQVTYTALKISA